MAGCRLARWRLRRKQQLAGRRAGHGDADRMHIVLLTCTRVKLLTLVLRSIESIAAPSRIRLQIWVDKPESTTVQRTSVLSLVHAIDSNHVWPGLKVIVFERHMGTRALWLTALSIRRPQLILEDDVVLLPGAYQWYMWSIKVMSTRHDIFGSSFHTSRPRLRLCRRPRRSLTLPYLTRIRWSDRMGSCFPWMHMTPSSHCSTPANRRTIPVYSSDLEGFISTTWYRNLY